MSIARKLLMGAAGAGSKSTYVDDVFSTYLYFGNCPDGSPNTTNTITNGIDLDGKGGLVWCKHRTGLLGSAEHILVDTERGVNKYLSCDASTAEGTGNSVSAFNSNGFTLTGQGPGGGTNYGQGSTTTAKYASWTFRKAPGFFDMVKYTGTGSARTLAHGLESVPGCIIIKRLDVDSYDWTVYHRAIDEVNGYINLNTNGAAASGNNRYDQGAPTASNFSIGIANDVNASGGEYIAYLFGGGGSTSATARSVHFNGSSGYLNTTSSSSDLTMGTGDFTIECWVSKDAQTHKGIWQISSTSGGMTTSNYGDTIALGYQNGVWQIYGGGTYKNSQSYDITVNEWYHTAYVRSSGVSTLYVNGIPVITQSDTNNYDGTYMVIGAYYNTSYLHNGKISNFRVIKGQALYTSPFHPPTEPLTNVTNTKVLCCNNASSVTGATITPATLQSNGSMTVQTSNPFDDLEGYKFGGDGDKGIIKTGSYVGNGANNGASIEGPKVYLGWEPSWVLIKSSTVGEKWTLFDRMRPNNDAFLNYLVPSEVDTEGSSNFLQLNSTGFQIRLGHDQVNANNETYIYIAIRSSDGYVGKPAEAGTDSFAMDVGNGSSTIPCFDSGFPVDAAIFREPAAACNWFTGGRLFGIKYVFADTNAGEANLNSQKWDSNEGFQTGQPASYQSWMWKRGQGFDVVTYTGNEADSAIPHSLGRAPEMMWFKVRNTSVDWHCWHKGLNGGTNAQNYYIKLNTDAAETVDTSVFGTLPTSSVFYLGSGYEANYDLSPMAAYLFASVDGISKCGYYTGTGSATTITTGFQPRFLLVKNADTLNAWNVVDTTRGWAAGNDERMWMNNNLAQSNSADMGQPTSTGFTLADGDARWNASGNNYIYYAHA